MSHSAYASLVVAQNIESCWEVLRKFDALPDFHPLITAGYIENNEPCDQVGCIRWLQLNDGGFVREQLVALDDKQYRLI